ncbi:MAG: chemotaxis protein CheW [Elainella sp. Prado103]|jgi:positive phototaxis protein PixI|nr:chemotaxis protein CheW [Elainella sp. Prado103]
MSDTSGLTEPAAVRPARSQQFLSFDVTTEIQALLPTDQLEEILSLESGQIVPIFDLSDAIMGISNHRGEVLWIVDLACLLGFESLFTQNYRQLYSVMVIKRFQSHVGVAVRQVGQLILLPSHKIQPLQPALVIEMTPRLAFCLKGSYQISEQKTMLILDGEKILDLLKAD